MLPLLLLACASSDPKTRDPAGDPAPGDTAAGPDDSAAGDTAGDTSPPETGAPEPTPMRLYLLAGQSNMDGYAYVTGLPPSLQVAQGDVRLYWSGSAAWTALEPASYGIYSGVEYFGPEVTFGRALADADPAVPVGLIKHAVGGTDLATYWDPGASRDDPAQGQGYRDFLAAFEAATAALDAEGTRWEIAGMLWMQGESDALGDLAQAEAYEANLARFIARVREDVSSPAMPFIIGKIHCPTCAHGDVVRAGETAVADADPDVYAFDTDDLPIHADGIHYDGSGMRTLGERFAEALLGLPLSATAGPAFALAGSYSSAYTGNFFLGYSFTVDRPITVTDLGTFDAGLTGIVYASQTALFDSSGALLARATIPAYYTAPTSPWDSWRYAAIEPLDLEPGAYVLASQVYSGAEDIYVHDAAVSAAPGFAWVEGRHKDGLAVDLPTIASAAPANWFGPNLLFVER